MTARGARDPRDCADRRRIERVPYETLIKVAAYDGQFPDESDFTEVPTTDVSPIGIGFLSADFPASETVVLQFGEWENPVFVSARVVHFTTDGPDRDFRIGCEFLSRIHTVAFRRP